MVRHRSGHRPLPRPRKALNPSAKLPRNAGLLIVEAAGEEWDRLSPWVLTEFPDCFDPEP